MTKTTRHSAVKSFPSGRSFPLTRLRRTRNHTWSRMMVAENQLSVSDLVWPIFIVKGKNKSIPIKKMPGVKRFSIDTAVKKAKQAAKLGIPAIAVFPNTPQKKRSAIGQEALNPENLVCRAVRAIKNEVPQIGIICDVALDPYTSHGHDGVMNAGGYIDNDATLEMLVGQSLNQAAAGCDILAPSDMMDGRIGVIRKALEKAGYSEMLLMSYAAKYASAFYGPFREAVGAEGNLKGDKRTYQMDPANHFEALHEVQLDLAEGADMVMVKPGMPYLDIVRQVKDKFQVPTFAYQVSGEFAMIEAAAKAGMLDRDAAIMESLMSFKRAGADGIFTYYAYEIAKKLTK